MMLSLVDTGAAYHGAHYFRDSFSLADSPWIGCSRALLLIRCLHVFSGVLLLIGHPLFNQRLIYN